MASQKIADFFAQIGIKVDENSIKKLGKSMADIERGLHNAEVSAKKAFKSAVPQAKDLNKAIVQGNKVLAQRADVVKKIHQMNNKALQAAKRASATAAFGGGGTTAAQEQARQSYFAKMQQEYMRSMEKLHKGEEKAARIRERAAKVAENVAKREAIMAQRTAAIREAGAKRAAAIIQAAEIRAQAMAKSAAARAVGRSAGRGSAFGGASIGGAVGASTGAIAGFLPGFGAAYSLMNANRINQELQGQRLAMTAVMGGEAAGNSQITWARDLAEQIGIDFRQSLPSFTKMLASGQSAGMTPDSVRNIFQGVSEYGRVMGLDTESMKGSMRAIEQMMNKQQVMSEELKLQLAERMPGVISAMAEAAGFGTDDDSVSKLFAAMEKGEVKSNKVLEEFAKILAERARVGGALEKAQKSTAAQQARFNNSVTRMIETLSAAGMDEGFGRIFQSMSKFLDENEKGIAALGQAFNKFSFFVEDTLEAVTNLGKGFDMLSDKLGITDSTMAILSATSLILMTRFGRMAAAAYAVFLILEDISVGMRGGDSYTKDFLEFLDENTWAAAAIGAASFAASLALVAGSILKIGGALGGLGGAAAGKGGKAGGILRTAGGFIRNHPYLTATAAAAGGYAIALDDFMTTNDPKISAEREQIDLRLKNLQRGPGTGFLTPETNKYQLPGINQAASTTQIEKIEISVNGTSNPEETANIVIKKFQELISPAVNNFTDSGG